MKRFDSEMNFVSPWMWRATAAALALVMMVGLTSALWLGTRAVVTGSPVPARALGTWTLSPGGSGDESEGQLTLRTNQADRVTYATSDLALADLAVQVRTRWLNGPDDAGYGLIVRYLGPDDFASLLIGPDGYIAVGQMSGGVWQWRVPWQQWPHIKRAHAGNLLRAQCRADHCRFYVNDEFAFEVNDVPAQGKIGPAVWSPAQGSTVSVEFQEWRVWK